MAKMGKAAKLAAKAMKPSRPNVTGADAEALAKADATEAVSGMWKGRVIGDAIVGDVLVDKHEKSKFKKGEEQRVVMLSTDGGAATIYCNASLDRALTAAGVSQGDRVAIVFKGEAKTGKGRPMRMYVAMKVNVARKGRK